ncbi:hypothetical protein [Pseudomonas sp. NPDC090208]|uniref:hypothetical protein n=1 Tax=Pseudomonas sp. NPDC090208 TaxID=3364478 RepID=UPI00381199F6
MGDIFERLGYQGAGKLLGSVSASPAVIKYANIGGNLLNGNFGKAANGFLDTVFGPSSNYGAGNVALAGTSWATLQAMYQESMSVLRERSNLWHVLVEPIGNVSAPRVNLLATEFSYNGVQLGYETKKIGSGFTQAPTGADPVELSLTCYDVDGEIKTWFENLKRLHAHPDGTFGLPSEYANTFTITHGAIEEGRGYSNSWVLVPVSCQVAQNRAVEEFSALNLTFTQYESFGTL